MYTHVGLEFYLSYCISLSDVLCLSNMLIAVPSMMKYYSGP
jgi:hypothetical protein